MSKNIWIINQYSGSPEYGMNFRSYYLAKEWIKKGYNVTIFSASYTHQRIKLPKISGIFTEENIDGIRYIWVKTPKYSKSTSIGRFFNMLIFLLLLFFYKDRNKPDIIIASSLSIFSTLNAYFWSKKYKCDFIFEVRDLWPQTFIEFKNVSEYHPLVVFMRFFEKLGYKKAKYVVSVLMNSKKYMIEKGMAPEKFVWINNGICLNDLKFVQDLPDNLFKKIPQNKFIVGYAGTIGIANAVDKLLEAAKLLESYKDITFLIVGKGSEKNNLIKKYGNLNNVVFLEAVKKTQIMNVLKYFDVCYLGLQKKSLFKYGVSPNKLFDYMLSARPILFAVNAGENNIVKMAECGLCIEAESIEAITDGVLAFYNMDEKKRLKLGLNGKKYVLENFTYEKLAESYEKLF